jgi:hypothetical protein
MSMKTAVFWDTVLCSLVMTDVSEELSAAFIRVMSYYCDIGSKFFWNISQYLPGYMIQHLITLEISGSYGSEYEA